MNLAIENKKVFNLWVFFAKKKKTHFKKAKQGFRICLGFPYFVEIKNFLLKVL